MPDPTHRDVSRAIEGLLEREDHHHALDVTLELLDPRSAPGPNLRADVPERPQAQSPRQGKQPKVEVGEVDRHEEVGLELGQRLVNALVGIEHHRKLGEDLEQPHHRELSAIEDHGDAGRAHLLSSDPEELERWRARLERPREERAVKVPRRLAREEKDSAHAPADPRAAKRASDARTCCLTSSATSRLRSPSAPLAPRSGAPRTACTKSDSSSLSAFPAGTGT